MAKVRIEQVFTNKTTAGASVPLGPTNHKFVGATIVTDNVGASPSATIAIQGSFNGTNFEDILNATATITTATTTIIKPKSGTINSRAEEWYPYYRLNISAITDIRVASASLAIGGFAGVDGD